MGKILKQITRVVTVKRLDKKIWMFFVISIIVISATVTAVTLSMTTATVITNRRDLALQQIEVLNRSVKSKLDTILNLELGIAMNPLVQEYLGVDNVSRYGQVNDLRALLQLVIDGNPTIDSIVLFGKGDDTRLFYRSANSVYNMERRIMEKYPDAVETGHYHTRLLYAEDIVPHGFDTLTMYMPVYSTSRLNRQLGVMAINFNYDLLTRTEPSDGGLNINILLLDRENHLFLSDNQGEADQNAKDLPGVLAAAEQSVVLNRVLYVRHEVSRWNLTLVGCINNDDILKENVKIVMLVLLIVAFLLIGFFIAGFQIVKRLYDPMNRLVGAMDRINLDNMTDSLPTDKMGEDFHTVAVGFNKMMRRLKDAMETIKNERALIERLRFSALQSQIQPHFLYNTLESIHWQALAVQNREVSEIVKALASYYRVVLSNGEDIIPLEQELLHVRNYVTIQNLRYDHIIEFGVDVEERYLAYRLPKITLQPLVENAICHGIRVCDGQRGRVRIAALEKDGVLKLTVENTGRSLSAEETEALNASLQRADVSAGYGISNVNKRLQLEFGMEYGLHFDARDGGDGGMKVTVTLPPVGETADGEEARHEKSDYCR